MSEFNMRIPQLDKIFQRLEAGEQLRVFLVHGDEEFLVHQTRKTLIARFVAPGEEDFRLKKVSAEKLSCRELIETLSSRSLFSSEQCFDVVNASYFSAGFKDRETDALKSHLETRVEPGITIIFTVAGAADKRSSLYKTVVKCGTVLEFPRFDLYKAGQVNRDEMYPYILSYLRGAGKDIAPEAFKELRSRKENDLYSNIQELEKLIAFSGTRKIITLDDVVTVVPPARSDHIFRLTDAILLQDLVEANRCIEELITRGTQATHIIQMMARQFRLLLQSSQLSSRVKNREILKTVSYPVFRDQVLPGLKKECAAEIEAGLFPVLQNHPFVIYKNIVTCEKFSENRLRQGLLVLREMDARVKSTGGLPVHLLREMIFTWNALSRLS